MDRRSFLFTAAGAGAAGLATAAGFMRWQEMAPDVHYPGRAEGHFLRDRGALPAPGEVGPRVTLWHPPHGGHVGFAQGRWPGHVLAMPQAVTQWLAHSEKG